jgi:hypothetical protein
MLELSKAIEEAKESDSSVVPGLVDKMGRPCVFNPILNPKLISQLDEIKDVIGYGPVLVSTLAGLILKDLSMHHRHLSQTIIYYPSASSTPSHTITYCPSASSTPSHTIT